MPNNSWLIKALTLAANVLRGNAVAITSVRGAGGYPSQIPNGMKVDQAEVGEEYGRITISIKNRSDKGDERDADIAVAYELGSGLTGPRGQRYLIESKKGKILRFPWEASRNIGTREGVKPIVSENPNEPGIAYLRSVAHPGIRPKPYLQKGLDASIDAIDAIITSEFEVNLLEILP